VFRDIAPAKPSQRGAIIMDTTCADHRVPGAFPSACRACDQHHNHAQQNTITHWNSLHTPLQHAHSIPQHHAIMSYPNGYTYNLNRLHSPPRSLTAQLALKRAAEDSDSDESQIQRPHDPQDPQQPDARRVAGMLTLIPQSIRDYTSNAFHNFIDYFRPPPYTPTQQTHIEGVATDHTDRKRRAVDASSTPYLPGALEGASPSMIVSRRSGGLGSSRAPQALPTSFNKNSDQDIAKRARWYREYNAAKKVDNKRPEPEPKLKTKLKAKKEQAETKEHTRIPLRDRQVSGLIDKAHRAQGGSFAQKAAQRAAQKAIEEKEAAQKAAAEKAAAEAEAARIQAEEEEARIQAEKEAARAQEIIVELPQHISDDLHQRMSKTRGERDTIIQAGSIPIQKLTFKRILASDKGTNNWLDDDAVNVWFNGIVDAKKRQTNYVKSDTNAPAFANLQTAWWEKASKEGAKGLKRWMKKAGVGGTNLLKCERLFLPINMGSHWTLLIINGKTQTIEYLDSLSNKTGSRFFKVARDLIKSELGNKYNAQEWTDDTDSFSSFQDNMSDCGVFTCLNGLAAAKDKEYLEAVTAEKMPRARKMIVGVFINGGFDGDFDL
jgi:sentrin-specific protease 1